MKATVCWLSVFLRTSPNLGYELPGLGLQRRPYGCRGGED
jgi:hypothetical protein